MENRTTIFAKRKFDFIKTSHVLSLSYKVRYAVYRMIWKVKYNILNLNFQAMYCLSFAKGFKINYNIRCCDFIRINNVNITKYFAYFSILMLAYAILK